jgi:hypothetical protein
MLKAQRPTTVKESEKFEKIFYFPLKELLFKAKKNDNNHFLSPYGFTSYDTRNTKTDFMNV